MLLLLVTINKFSTIFAVQDKFVGLLLFVIYWSIFKNFILMAHIVLVYIDIYTTFKVDMNFVSISSLTGKYTAQKLKKPLQFYSMDMFTSYGHINKPK